MKIHKLAGIDIGSNSVRLLVSNVVCDEEDVNFRKSSLTRLPIRLGTDAFNEGTISFPTMQKLVEGMKAYSHIMNVHGVERFRACATSALREADNGEAITHAVYDQTGIRIELINGAEEARMIFNSESIQDIRDQEDTFVYIDVGGGSTELTVFHQGKITASRSFKIGTIRLLNDNVSREEWQAMKTWIKAEIKHLGDTVMVGSGGNINRVLKMAGKKSGQNLKLEYLEDTAQMLSKFSVDDRIMKFDLNPDRADVITHALKIYTYTMSWAGAEKMIVPKKGLADGIIRDLYRRFY